MGAKDDKDNGPATLKFPRNAGLKSEVRDTATIVTLTPADVGEGMLQGTKAMLLDILSTKSTRKAPGKPGENMSDTVVLDLSALEFDHIMSHQVKLDAVEKDLGYKGKKIYDPRVNPESHPLNFGEMLLDVRKAAMKYNKHLILVAREKSDIMQMINETSLSTLFDTAKSVSDAVGVLSVHNRAG